LNIGAVASGAAYLIVPTRRKGMHPVMLRVTVAHGSRHALSAERGASLAAFLYGVCERSHLLHRIIVFRRHAWRLQGNALTPQTMKSASMLG
jgi:hypothetical protein